MRNFKNKEQYKKELSAKYDELSYLAEQGLDAGFLTCEQYTDITKYLHESRIRAYKYINFFEDEK